MTKIIRNGSLVQLSGAEEIVFLSDLPLPDLRALSRERREQRAARAQHMTHTLQSLTI